MELSLGLQVKCIIPITTATTTLFLLPLPPPPQIFGKNLASHYRLWSSAPRIQDQLPEIIEKAFSYLTEGLNGIILTHNIRETIEQITKYY